MNAEQAWQSVLAQLQMEMPRASYDTWVRDTRPMAYENGIITVGVRNAYARDWLESRLATTVSRLLIGILNSNVTVEFVVFQAGEADSHTDPDAERVASSIEITPPEPKPRHFTLNPRYTFDTYVVGSGNRLAHAACQAVVEKPARAYNPLFLYGGVGLGKTHLLHAIGNACHADGLNVLYVSSEEFTNDMINAIRGQDKQIIVSSDRPPKSLVTLEERLRSRFEWGLTADIQAPDFETRLAILRSKAERTGRHISDEILESVARQVQSNIRELEGALNRIVAFADLSGASLTPSLVEVALADLLPQKRNIQPDRVIEAVVAAYEGIAVDDLLGQNRAAKIAIPRQLVMYILSEFNKVSSPQIGDLLGGRDHTTVLYGIKKVAGDEKLKRRAENIWNNLLNQAVAV